MSCGQSTGTRSSLVPEWWPSLGLMTDENYDVFAMAFAPSATFLFNLPDSIEELSCRTELLDKGKPQKLAVPCGRSRRYLEMEGLGKHISSVPPGAKCCRTVGSLPNVAKDSLPDVAKALRAMGFEPHDHTEALSATIDGWQLWLLYRGESPAKFKVAELGLRLKAMWFEEWRTAS